MRQSQTLNKPSGIFLAAANIYGWYNYIKIVWLIIWQENKQTCHVSPTVVSHLSKTILTHHKTLC